MFALKDGLPVDELPPPPRRRLGVVQVYGVLATLALVVLLWLLERQANGDAAAFRVAATRVTLATLLSFVAITTMDTTLVLASVCVSTLAVAPREPTPLAATATAVASCLLGVAAALVLYRRLTAPLVTRALVVASTALLGWTPPALPLALTAARFACAFVLHFALLRANSSVTVHAHLANVLWILSAPLPLVGCLAPVLLFINARTERVSLD